MMLTTDLALKVDPEYAAITKRFRERPEHDHRQEYHARNSCNDSVTAITRANAAAVQGTWS